jgi:Xaa-Pro aminopeptidase
LDRIFRLRESMSLQEIDCMLIGSSINRRYLCNFSGSDGWLFVTGNNIYLAVDFRYIEQARKETRNIEVLHVKGAITTWLPVLLTSIGVNRLGIESEHLSVQLYSQLENAIKCSGKDIFLLPSVNIVESIRATKDMMELSWIRQATQISDMAIDHAQKYIREGVSERAIAWELESFSRQHGSETIPFEVIVASGPNAALPHAKPTDRVICKGDVIVIDLGARVDGYCSDITRTFSLSEGTAEFYNIFNIVLGAQLSALSLLSPGMNGDTADNLIRKMINNAGYEEAFGHGLGHGVGLETHEYPRIGPKSDHVLSENMVFTIEPGIYIPGWGGVRIEDTVTINNGSIQILTCANKSALIQGG